LYDALIEESMDCYDPILENERTKIWSDHIMDKARRISYVIWIKQYNSHAEEFLNHSIVQFQWKAKNANKKNFDAKAALKK